MEKFRYEDLASLAYELPDEVLNYRMSGDLKGERDAIYRWLEKPVAEGMKQRLRLELTFLAQLKNQFPYTQEEVIQAFRPQIPDFSERDLVRLDLGGLAEWIWLEGRKHYIHNIVRNVLRKDKEMLDRAGLKNAEAEELQLLNEAIEDEKANGSVSWKFRVRETIRLKDEEFYPGILLKVHLPLPALYHQVESINILSYDPAMKAIDPEDALFRTIYFEGTLEENREFFVEYEYVIKTDYHDLNEDKLRDSWDTEYPEEVAEYLEEQYPHIRFSPYLKTLAKEIVGDAYRPLQKAWRIYNYITKNVQYSYMREYYLMEDVPQYCARNLRGDCGVQALLFITLCRIAGVPAKWQSGLYTHPLYIGSHDWAMFYAEPYGWLYADLSFGGSAHEDGDEERRRFYFGNLDPFRMPANNAFQQPFLNPKSYLPIDPYDNQQGEMESDQCGYSREQVVRTQTLVSAEKLTK